MRAPRALKLMTLHQNAQRLLRPLMVVNPLLLKGYRLQATRTRLRRDHAKYLTLIEVVTLVHQYQRPVKTRGTWHGQTIEYIEVERRDIEVADKLFAEVLEVARWMRLPPQTRKLLTTVRSKRAWVMLRRTSTGQSTSATCASRSRNVRELDKSAAPRR